MSTSARATILARLGASEHPDLEYAAIERAYQSAGLRDEDHKLKLFIERLIEYGAGVYRCAHAEIALTIATRLRARSAQSIAVPKDIPREWLPEGFEFLEDDHLSYQQLDRCDGTITGCALAIADTGTLILDAASSQGRRALTLLPDYHLCVVFDKQVFETVPEAIKVVSNSMSCPLTLISGPSATADIEMTRIQGVHGPRSMEVILVT